MLLSYHAAADVHGTKFKQLLHLRSQFPVANSCEVVEGEELKVLREVAWKRVESLQNPSHDIKMEVCEQINELRLFGEQRDAGCLLFSKTAGPEEVFHVEQLHP